MPLTRPIVVIDDSSERAQKRKLWKRAVNAVRQVGPASPRGRAIGTKVSGATKITGASGDNPAGIAIRNKQ